MEYNFLAPNCGLRVSAICLGAMTFQKGGHPSMMGGVDIDPKASFEILDKFVELGGNFIDTANMYSHGESEEIIGEWMKERGNRKDMVIATKVRWAMGGRADPKKPNGCGLSRKHIMEAVEGSLKRLQTDYIDLYQIHGPDTGTSFAEVIRTMDDLVRSGKVRYVGACNLTGWQLQKFVEVGRQLGTNPWVTLQSYYSLLGRMCELDGFTVCKNEGLGVLPWGALNGGMLTGKFKKGDKQAPKGSRMELGTKMKMPLGNFPDVEKYLKDEKYWALRDAMQKMADSHGKTVSQVAIRWLLQSPPVTSVIVGTTKVHQLEDNMGAAGWRLKDEEMAELNKLTALELQYPHDMMTKITYDGRDKEPAHV